MSEGKYGPDSELLEFIYGITYEIWEERGVELIRQYYARDIPVYALTGVTFHVDDVVNGTRDTLAAFPDRLLLAEDVIWSDDGDGEYSSHRIMSPMTNQGTSIYGPATNKQVRVRTIADCWVQEGVITKEWLIRDTLPLVQQLGFEPVDEARKIASNVHDITRAWWAEEHARRDGDSTHAQTEFALGALSALWLKEEGLKDSDHNEKVGTYYAPFAVYYPDPLTHLSGSDAIAQYGQTLRDAFTVDRVKVDHIAQQTWGHAGTELAVRWTLSATHTGSYQNLEATGKPVFVLGSSHWRIINGKIATEWTVFDGMGVLAQLVD